LTALRAQFFETRADYRRIVSSAGAGHVSSVFDPEILLNYNDQAKANERIASHIAAQSSSDNSTAMTNMARAFGDSNATQADGSDCEGPSSLLRLRSWMRSRHSLT
jgi:hypothetical protein